jgi:DsbC/DsbD-like thiol-disulfide interchange protein
MTGCANRAPFRRTFFVTNGVFLVTALQLISVGGLSCQPAEDPSPHSSAELISEVQSIRPGEPFTVALRITLDPGWHSYWLNPGDAGQPAAIDWKIPAGFRAGEIQWPYPRTVEESTVVSYGYEDEVVLLTEILPPRFMTTGQTARFAAEARWLVCDNICLPASADLEVEVTLTDEPPVPAPRRVSMFAEARSRLPIRVDLLEMSASLDDESIVLQIIATDDPGGSFDGAHFFASERGVISHAAPQIVVQEDGIVRITLRKSQFLREPLDRLTGVLVLPDALNLETGTTRALAVDAAVR